MNCRGERQRTIRTMQMRSGRECVRISSSSNKVMNMNASKKRKLIKASGNPSKKLKQNVVHENSSFHGGEFHAVRASLVLPLPPTFVSNPKAGVQEMLDSMVMR